MSFEDAREGTAAMSFEEALRAFELHLRAERNASPHTRRAYAADVRQLAAARGSGPILPDGVTLNVNNPPLHRAALNGVRLTRQGRSTLYTIVYETTEDGTVMMGFQPSTKRESVENADTTAIAEGFVSITPLDASWTAGTAAIESLEPLAQALQGFAPAQAAAAAGTGESRAEAAAP